MKNTLALIFAACVLAAYNRATTTAPTVAPVVQEQPRVECTTILDTDDYHDAVCINTLGGTTSYTRTMLGSRVNSVTVIGKAEYERALVLADSKRAFQQCLYDNSNPRGNDERPLAVVLAAIDACKK